MRDFLTHLASRAVAPAPAVRPLVRTPYEQQVVGEFELPEALPATSIRGFQPLPGAQPRPSLTPGRDSEIVGGKTAPRQPQPVSPAHARNHEAPPTIVAAPVQVAARLKALGETIPRPIAATPGPRRKSPNPVPAPVIVTGVGTKAISHAVTAPVESVVPTVAEKIPAIPIIEPAAVTQRPSAAPLRPRVQTAPQEFPHLSPAPPVAAAPQPAPQVTVTIGRVEIRAAAPAVQAPLPATNSRPPLSLDTYLRQRASRSA